MLRLTLLDSDSRPLRQAVEMLGCALAASGIILIGLALSGWGDRLEPPGGLPALAALALAGVALKLLARNRQRLGALTQSEQDLNHAQAVAHVGSWHIESCRGTINWSAETYRIFGLRPGTPVTFDTFLDFVHPDDRTGIERAWKDALAGVPYDIEHRILVADTVRWVRERAELEFGPDGEFIGATGSVQDITDRKTAEEALFRSRQRLRDLGAHYERLREEERAHVAREIHDELGQYLTTLRMDTAMLQLTFGTQDPKLSERLTAMKGLIDETIRSVRRVATSLRPTALDLGLESAIEWLVADFLERNDATCTLRVTGGPFNIDDMRATLVFRILQEALTNVSRHANAHCVTIELDADTTNLSLIVKDDGIGFDPTTARIERTFGLLGMRERAMAFGGRLSITSAPGGGAEVALSVPLSDLATEAAGSDTANGTGTRASETWRTVQHDPNSSR